MLLQMTGFHSLILCFESVHFLTHMSLAGNLGGAPVHSTVMSMEGRTVLDRITLFPLDIYPVIGLLDPGRVLFLVS